MLLGGLAMLFISAGAVGAQELPPGQAKKVQAVTSTRAVASPSATPTQTLVATAAAEPVIDLGATAPREDLTQPKEAKSRLERVLEEKGEPQFRGYNFLQYAIWHAVASGVPINTLVLMMLFPLVAAIIAAARHIIGLQGFGIFTPAVIAVAFLATGVTVGVLLFISIMVVATLARVLLKRLHLPSLPRMALLLWFVSLGVLGVMLASPWIGVKNLVSISIFPIMLLILMAETFIEVQTTRNFQAAIQLAVETFILALAAFLVISTQSLQEWVLVNPEMAVLMIAGLDILIGRYSGLRLLEYWRFRELLKQ